MTRRRLVPAARTESAAVTTTDPAKLAGRVTVTLIGGAPGPVVAGVTLTPAAAAAASTIDSIVSIDVPLGVSEDSVCCISVHLEAPNIRLEVLVDNRMVIFGSRLEAGRDSLSLYQFTLIRVRLLPCIPIR